MNGQDPEENMSFTAHQRPAVCAHHGHIVVTNGKHDPAEWKTKSPARSDRAEWDRVMVRKGQMVCTRSYDDDDDDSG